MVVKPSLFGLYSEGFIFDPNCSLKIKYTNNEYIPVIVPQKRTSQRVRLSRRIGKLRQAMTDNGDNDTSVQSQFTQ